jgi:hypothetical protein
MIKPISTQQKECTCDIVTGPLVLVLIEGADEEFLKAAIAMADAPA